MKNKLLSIILCFLITLTFLPLFNVVVDGEDNSIDNVTFFLNKLPLDGYQASSISAMCNDENISKIDFGVYRETEYTGQFKAEFKYTFKIGLQAKEGYTFPYNASGNYTGSEVFYQQNYTTKVSAIVGQRDEKLIYYGVGEPGFERVD